MKLNPHTVYVIATLVLMTLIGFVTDIFGNNSTVGASVLLCLVIPLAMFMAGRIGRLTYDGLLGAGLFLWLFAWTSIIFVLRRVVISLGSDFTFSATLATNWQEISSSLVLFVAGSLVWKFLFEKAHIFRVAS